MSNGSDPTPSHAELEEAGAQVLAGTARDQMRQGVAALRGKLAAAKDASEKAAAADQAAMDAYLRSPAPKSEYSRN